MLVNSQKDLDRAAERGEALIEIGSMDAFSINGRYSPEVRFVDPSHLCLLIGEQAAPHLILGEMAACITVTVTGRARPLIDVSETGRPKIEVRESATPRIQVFGAAVATVDCYDSSTPRLDVAASAALRIRAFNRAHPRIWAHERASVRIQGRGDVFADDGVQIHHDGAASIVGGVSTLLPSIKVEEGE